VRTDGLPRTALFSSEAASVLKAATFDRKVLGARGLGYERLDQLTLEVILGVR
jgi:xylose isomerase